MEDHYSTLQVRPTASAEEIERAYRRLARQNHPDLLRDVPPDVRLRAEEVLKRVNQAHRVLGDRERRRAYDHERVRRAAAPSRAAAAAPARPAAPGAARPPAAERTSHWGAGGPIDIDWATPPPRVARPRDTDIFSPRRLILGVVLIVVVTLILMFLWNPSLGQVTPTPLPIPTP
jgi:curved DNA-binding protein CbpA